MLKLDAEKFGGVVVADYPPVFGEEASDDAVWVALDEDDLDHLVRFAEGLTGPRGVALRRRLESARAFCEADRHYVLSSPVRRDAERVHQDAESQLQRGREVLASGETIVRKRGL